MATTLSKFERLFLKSSNQVHLSVLLLLAWISVADGNFATSEDAAIKAFASDQSTDQEVKCVIETAQEGHIYDLQLACEAVRKFAAPERRLLLQLAVGISLEDRVLVTSENHILRFLADLLELGSEGLDDIFREMTGQEYPTPTDTSYAQWWDSREQKRRAREKERWGPKEGRGSGHEGEANGSNQGFESVPRRLKDLAILGLDEDATADDIRSAYRRMAQVHHPDRYAALGKEAVAAAEQTFCRIKAAFDRLTQR